MKKAVIAVGSHFAGKSKTINKYLKEKLGIGKYEHKFILNNQNGFILSQSFEEADRNVDDVISKYSGYELLVLSARPAHEKHSSLKEALSKLSRAGFRTSEVQIEKNTDEKYYIAKAKQMLGYLDR